MNGQDFLGLPKVATTYAGEVDTLFYTFVGVSTVVTLGIFFTGLYFSIRYHRGSSANRDEAPAKLRREEHHIIEYAWYLIPIALFLGGFYWAAHLYAKLFTPPADAMNIYVVAKQWMWKMQHPTGQREIDVLHVPRGVPIRLVMTSQDVIHSLYVPAFRIKQDVVPGKYLSTWFKAETNGEYKLLCAEYCGTEHSHMRARIVVIDPADYERWLQEQPSAGSLAAQGAEKFRAHGCSGCHASAERIAPDLTGLYGSSVPLFDGGFVVADERYIRDSILFPRKQVVAGFGPIMPSFQGQISEEDILAIIAYIKSLSAGSAPRP